DAKRVYLKLILKKTDGFRQGRHRKNIDTFYDRRFARVRLRYDHAFEAVPSRLNGDGQDTFDGTEAAIERQLTHNNKSFEFVCGDLSGGFEHAQSDGKIIGRALLAYVGGREVHHRSLARHKITAVLERGFNPQLAFL